MDTADIQRVAQNSIAQVAPIEQVTQDTTSPLVIIATIAVYLAGLFAIAWASSRRADNATFFTGNRRSPWFVAALGMIAAPMSGVTFVSVPGMVGTAAFSYLQMALGFVCGYLVIAFVLVPLYYRLHIVSIYEYLQGRFGGSSHRTGAWFFFISKMLGAAVRIYLVCTVLQLIVFEPLGVPFTVNVGAMMLLVWLYTFRGGVRSLVWTDALKTLCLLASVGLSIWFIAREMGMSPAQMFDAVRSSELSRVFFFDDLRDGRYFFKQFFAGLFVVVAMTGLDQDMMQVPLSCRSPRDAQKNLVLSGAMQLFVIAMFLCLGVILNIYAEGSGLGVPASGDELSPLVATSAGLGPIVGIVFALGLISSTYSAAGSALTALTTSFTVDILGEMRNGGNAAGAASMVGVADKRLEHRADKTQEAQETREARLARVRRFVHAGMAVAMAGVVLCFRALNSGSVIDAVYTLASYTYGPILGMFVFGMTTWRTVRDRWVPLVAILSPALCLVLDMNSEAWFDGYRFSYELLILNALFTFAGLALLSINKDRRRL